VPPWPCWPTASTAPRTEAGRASSHPAGGSSDEREKGGLSRGPDERSRPLPSNSVRSRETSDTCFFVNASMINQISPLPAWISMEKAPGRNGEAVYLITTIRGQKHLLGWESLCGHPPSSMSLARRVPPVFCSFPFDGPDETSPDSEPDLSTVKRRRRGRKVTFSVVFAVTHRCSKTGRSQICDS
jgi:hypothetical protein